MSRGRLTLIGLALGLMASQAGHLVAYQLRFGPAAATIQTTGAHTYFPGLVKTAVGLAATFVLLALISIAFARLIAGRRLEAEPAPAYLRLVAMLFCVQLTCFVVQEALEIAAGAPATSAPALLLWGTLGQLPVALVAAAALRWLAIRLGPAVAHLLAPPAPTLFLAPQRVALAVWPAPVAVVVPGARLRHSISRRGPPF